MKGDFVGIGVNFYIYKDTVAVIKPIEKGPSEKRELKLETEFYMLTTTNYLAKITYRQFVFKT